MVKLGFSKDTVRGFIPPGALQGPELQRILAQALDRVMSPTDRDGALTTALANASQSTLPEKASELTAFVFGPLHDVVESAFGTDTAERLLYSLTPFLKQACRHEATAAEQDGAEEPALAAADDQVDPPRAGQPPAAPTSSDDPSAVGAHQPLTSGATILVVDNEPHSRASLSQSLRTAGYEVFTAPDGHVALAVCMRNRPDAVVAALGLPTVGGRQLMALLRVAFAADAPPVVLLTDAESGPAKVDGAAATVSRPIDPQELLRTIESVVVEPGTEE